MQRGEGSIPGRETKIPRASQPKRPKKQKQKTKTTKTNIKQKEYCNEFNKDFSQMVQWKKSWKKDKILPLSTVATL